METVSGDINEAFRDYRQQPTPAGLEAVAESGRLLVWHFVSLYGGGCCADDLYQCGMLGLLRAVKSYDPSCGAQFSTWASCCIGSEIRHFARRERQQLVPAAETAPQTAPLRRPERRSFHLDVEDRIALEQVLKKLTDIQRRVIDALFYRGLTQEQTARELGVSQRQVSRMRQRILERLREMLEAPNFRLVDNSQTFHAVKK